MTTCKLLQNTCWKGISCAHNFLNFHTEPMTYMLVFQRIAPYADNGSDLIALLTSGVTYFPPKVVEEYNTTLTRA